LLSAALCRVHYSIFRSWPASQRYSYYSFGGLPILLLSSCQKKQNWRSCVVPFRFFLLFLRQETEQQHFTDAFVQDYRYGEIEMTVHESPGAQHVSVAPAAASPLLPCISLFRPVAHSRRSDSSSSLINIFRDSDDLSCPLLPPLPVWPAPGFSGWIARPAANRLAAHTTPDAVHYYICVHVNIADR
jgi:hypothetical protein